MKKQLYPGVEEAEKQKGAYSMDTYQPERPDFIAGKPNYDKHKGNPERVLVWLNID